MNDEVREVLDGERRAAVAQADCIKFMRQLPDASVDLVFGSPPYEQARLYLEDGRNLGIARNTEEWVAWMVEVFTEAQRVSKGLVAFVVAGQTRKYRWSAGPALLMADLCRKGFNLRNPPIFHRVGIPGSGGPDWLRNDYEWIVCTSRPGKLPWSDNCIMGHPPKWAPGGAMSHRVSNGTRVNQWGKTVGDGENVGTTSKARKANGTRDERERPSHRTLKAGYATSGHQDGDTPNGRGYDPPTLANPGNVLRMNVGGGQMGGDKFSSQNEAPFPEQLATFFALSFCRPVGVCLDPFAGSGTSLAMAVRHGRRAIGCDLRASQVELTCKRLMEETPLDLLRE